MDILRCFCNDLFASYIALLMRTQGHCTVLYFGRDVRLMIINHQGLLTSYLIRYLIEGVSVGLTSCIFGFPMPFYIC